MVAGIAEYEQFFHILTALQKKVGKPLTLSGP